MSSHPKTTVNKADRIRELNDRLRKHFRGGAICVTRGVADRCNVDAALAAVKTFCRFNEANDPLGLHSFGAIELDGHTLFWVIDCYENDMRQTARDPADNACQRVLTLCLDVEY